MDLYQKVNNRVYVIAEMSANHGGSLERAKEIIRVAKENGADCIKIQTYTADTMTIDCDNKYFNLSKGTWAGENLYSLYEKAYTPWEWHDDLKQEAEKNGIDFLSTPFDISSMDFLEEAGMEYYKIASFELVDIPLIKYIASKGKPIIMSTGMSNLGEIQEAVDVIKEAGCQLVLLKCTSAYPTVYEEMNIRTMANLKETFDVPVGLSDHSMGDVAALAAVALGGKVIEKHLCLDRSLDTPDSVFSMEPEEFKNMVQRIRQMESVLGKVNYNTVACESTDIINRRSVFVVQDIREGELLTKDNVRIIRPGYGLKPKYYDEVIGQRALQDIKRGTPLCFELIGR